MHPSKQHKAVHTLHTRDSIAKRSAAWLYSYFPLASNDIENRRSTAIHCALKVLEAGPSIDSLIPMCQANTPCQCRTILAQWVNPAEHPACAHKPFGVCALSQTCKEKPCPGLWDKGYLCHRLGNHSSCSPSLKGTDGKWQLGTLYRSPGSVLANVEYHFGKPGPSNIAIKATRFICVPDTNSLYCSANALQAKLKKATSNFTRKCQWLMTSLNPS